MVSNFRTPVATGVVLAVLVGGGAHTAWRDHEATVARSFQILHDMAEIVEHQGHGTIGGAEAALSNIVGMVARAGGPEAVRDRTHWEEMNRMVSHVGGRLSTFVFDEVGNSVLETAEFPARAVNVADRDYFHAAKRGESLHVGAAIVTRTGSGIAFTITKPLRDAEGRFIGAVSVGLDTEHVTDALNHLNFGMAPSIGIFRPDGGIVAYVPDMEKHVGQSVADGALMKNELPKAPSGSFRLTSVMDGKGKLAAYTTMRDYGLVGFAAIEEDVVLAPWRERALAVALETLAGVAISLAALAWGLTGRRRADRAQARLIEATTEAEKIQFELQQARHDQLTGLPGRAMFLNLARAMQEEGHASGAAAAVMYIDLDGFKAVNDRFGHDRGDEVLRSAARAIRAGLRHGDLAGRLGGDEFAVLVIAPPRAVRGLAASIAERIVAQVAAIGMGVGCSVGIALSTDAGVRPTDLLHRADEAMYRAKKGGKGRYAFDDGSPVEDVTAADGHAAV